MKRVILATLIFTGVWAAMWDTPEADLSLARLHITTPAGSIQNRPRFLVNVSGITSLTSLYLEDTASERTSSLPIIKGYPEAQVSLRFGKFEVGLSGEQTLDAGGEIWEQESPDVLRSLDLYRLSAEAAWWPSQRVGLVAGYNHHLGWLTREEKDSTASQAMEAFGHTPGFSAGLLLALTERLQLDVVLHSPTTPLQLKGTISNQEHIQASISLPLKVLTDVRIAATDRFEGFFTLSYAFTSSMDSLYLDLDADYVGPISTIPLYEYNTLALQIGAGYRIIPPLNLRLWGKYSSCPVDSLDLSWPNPSGISVAAEGVWEQGAWRFAAEIGTRRFHPILSEKGTRLEGNSYHLRIGLGLVI
ncbi:MAG: hypothetical protein E3J71_04165 [Candidatus Stahlbacteria bacterium]|nr:MAG: hypothetical protein E3J71_04165 [Candidatus Stahlbacteria bacterium]